MAHYPCGFCEKSIDDSKQSSIFCELCKFIFMEKFHYIFFLELPDQVGLQYHHWDPLILYCSWHEVTEVSGDRGIM